VRISGRIRADAPVIGGRISGGVLHLGVTGGVEFVVDTGFSGAFVVPQRMAAALKADFAGYDRFTLATGEPVELPVYAATVRVGRRIVRTWLTIGEALIGMEFLREACDRLEVDFDAETITLALR
jgi:predicted aspartyl protease